ncbi:MAG TPA: type III-B CRISPR module RAMP protein Cmr1 [Chthonomonadaceae bacterium]|nr:type III-B CRISPR module RAMP protein Cmr1 [Chthonomonadaceae bacterium]
MPICKYADIGAPPVWDASQRDSIEVSLRTITPLFGGGYEARNVDPVCVVRPAAIRGHLRFWWRATAGAQYPTAANLFEAEEALWGSATKRGAVALTVTLKDGGKQVKCGEYNVGRSGSLKGLPDFQRNWPPYALQPFQGKADRTRVIIEPSYATTDAAFDLILSLSDVGCADEVRRSVIAWVTLGGLGARVRRGCGSLATATTELLTQGGNVTGSAKLLTVLSGSRAMWGQPIMDPIRAWNAAVEVYWGFRQKRGYARNPGTDRPGRSRWPEPDTIRRITARSAPGHKPEHPSSGFPRADLGLPIVFQFKDKNAGDPSELTLQGSDRLRQRFASPVITKAVACGQNEYRPLIVILDSPHVWELGDLDLNGSRISRDQIDLDRGARDRVFPLQGLPVREALAKYVLDQAGWEKARVFA